MPILCHSQLTVTFRYSQLALKRHPIIGICSLRKYSSPASKVNVRPRSNSWLTYFVGFGAAGGLAAYFFIPSESRSAPTYGTKPLSPSYFTPSVVLSTKHSGPDTKLLTLKVSPQLLPAMDSSSVAPIWSVFIKDDDIQVERPYTPLEGVDNEGHMSFWIKKYDKGEVGRWLHSKKPGDTVEMRGPLNTWEWKDDTWDDVVMISGGTGITPFYQLFHNLISGASQSNLRTCFTLLHSSRIPSELPPHDMLQALTDSAAIQPSQFKLHFFVDSLDGPQNTSLPSNELHVGRIGRNAIEGALALEKSTSWWQRFLSFRSSPSSVVADRKILFLICGPDQMVTAIAGPYGRNFSQGEVGGILGELGYTSDQVRKL